MNRLKDRFLSEISRAESEQRSRFVCGDCRFYKKKKCPMDIKYDLSQTCYFYEPSKEQRKFERKTKNKKLVSITMNSHRKKKQKKKIKNNPKESKNIFTNDGFIRCNLRYSFRVKKFIESFIEKERWKCKRRRCKSKQVFEVKAKHPTRQYKIMEDLIFKVSDVNVEFKLVCPSCNFLHNFPKLIVKEIREFIKTLNDENVFKELVDDKKEIEMITHYVAQLAYPDGFEEDPIHLIFKGTLAYKACIKKIRKIARRNSVEPKNIIGLMSNRNKSCLVLNNATFLIIPNQTFSFAS